MKKKSLGELAGPRPLSRNELKAINAGLKKGPEDPYCGCRCLDGSLAQPGGDGCYCSEGLVSPC